MEEKDLIINKHIYNIFSICEDFRQRVEQLNRLKDQVLNDKESKKDE